MRRRLSSYEKMIAPNLRAVPGVKPWKDGHFVPYNTIPLVGGPARPDFTGRFPLNPLLHDWIGDYLLPYQWEGAFYATRRTAFHNWSVTGSGKTLAALVALLAKKGPWLISCPGSVRPVITEQLRQYSKVTVAHLMGQTPHTISPAPDEVYVIGHEVFPYWEEQLRAHPWRMVVDEEHMLRDKRRGKYILQGGEKVWVDGDNRSAAFARVADEVDWYLGLTASPIPKNLIDIWGILDLAERRQWGSRHDFGTYYLGAEKTDYSWVYGKEIKAFRLEEFRARIRYVSHQVTRKALGALPGVRFQFPILSPAEQNRPAAFAQEIKKAAKEGNLTEARLRESSTRKTSYILFRVEQAVKEDQHVLIFTGRHPETEDLCEKIRAHLKKKGMEQVPVEFAHGGVDLDERYARRTRYMETKGAAVLVVTGYSVGIGWNFSKTDLAIFAFLPWTPEFLIQWLGRFPRLGQDRPTLLCFPICEGTVDEEIYHGMFVYLPAVFQVMDEDTLKEWQDKYEESEDYELVRELERTLQRQYREAAKTA